MVLERINEVGDKRFRQRDFRYASGAMAIAVCQFIDLDIDDSGRTSFLVEGLPMGWLGGSLDTDQVSGFPVTGSIDLRLPRAQLDATLERLAGIPHLKITSVVS